jgi:hypothetical protein
MTTMTRRVCGSLPTGPVGLVNFLDIPEGSVSSSLLFEPGKPPMGIPAIAASSETPPPLNARRW